MLSFPRAAFAHLWVWFEVVCLGAPVSVSVSAEFRFRYFFPGFWSFCGWCFVFFGGRMGWCIGGVIGWVEILFAPFDNVVELRFWVCVFRVCGFASRISGCR